MLKNIPVGDTERPVPGWALRLAKALPFIVLPQCLWRLPFAFDFCMGLIDEKRGPWEWWAVPYVFGLSLVTESVTLLTLGLVSGWGEVFPRWVPFLRGRRVPPLVATVPALLGGAVVTFLFDLLGFIQGVDIFAPERWGSVWWMVLARICITPAMLWGPITLALAVAYHRRRTRPLALAA
ncbi:hypothetical protein [Streptomyces rubellomurinus]|uniref:Uncharacterized protein n=2 Tax=Streptomyces TaxID=1883 RepID=A0A0F2THJ7_STRR3|nr:hypothetical protein [Streptomyces rubellomurinus]KJS55778.1 hypothetical protein VM98_10915 [Streptomyces rubellomurinus subsp. indigoferus]KJS61182.1 hypothetical protein VM95_16525 [Streptomyces rubellomurinus]